MSSLKSLSKAELEQRLQTLRQQYLAYQAQNLQLDMSRGKPGVQQLDLSLEMLECVNPRDSYTAANGFDARNYGVLDGLPEVKALFADILGVTPDQVIVGGNSSLNMMFDYIATCYSKGVCGHTPWCQQGTVKFLCPVPGYDRHFAVTEFFGIQMIPVKMTPYGPKMEEIEELVKDPAVKGMWCVPMYSNPDGITYSDETVRRLAALKPAAPDFRIIWDNAYCLHHLEDEGDVLLNIYPELVKNDNEDMVVMFTSTSKISFPGSGVAALAASPANVADVKKRMTIQTIGHDKLNMLRHIRFFGDIEGVKRHMKLHAAVLRPRFRVVLDTLESQLANLDIAHWHQPRGGYFVSVNVMDGCAKRTVQLLKEAGVVMTGAGATYPYGNDPKDSNIRIAPSYPAVEELAVAMELFCLCVELACVEKLLAE
ncbi:MAG: aminotransferase class I/II-fold pyridoxal phosphate-dependent enzyme [Ruminococcaceae bacterium]|nr:aminotransferase class I/II-fold pyridoxal phosphate-dependent enzyme [Oscillospiraceae bacterium]